MSPARGRDLWGARGPFLLLTLCAACGPAAGEQRPAPEPSPADVPTAHVRSYLDAFNTGRPEVLAPVLERMYAPSFLAAFGDASAAAWERLELHRTYGPLALAFVDTVSAPPIVWSRGTVSRGWVGHQLFLNHRGQATRHSIWRARPVPYPDPATSAAQVTDSLGAYLDQLADAGLFSGSVVVSRHGMRVIEGSWGNDGQEAPAPVARDTRFHTASVTKLLTVTALLQLVETGVVHLEDTIGHWIPEYPQPYRDSVRVRHLLTHTSGIELDDDPAFLAHIRVARSAADLLEAQIRAINGRQPEFPAGSDYDYTSEGIDLLGVIMERATGRSWTDVVRHGVLEPAGMRHTRFAVPTLEGAWALGRTSLAPDLQTTLPGELRPALDVLTVVAKPSSGVWSTAEDLHCFTRALLEHRLLGEAWTDSLLTPRLETGELPRYGIRGWVGLGAQGEDLWGTRTVGHGGVVPGYSAAIEYLPENGWLLTVVSSTGEATGFLVFQRFLELVANDRSPRPADATRDPPGWYRAGPDHLVLVTRAPDSDQLRWLDFDSIRFAALHPVGAGAYQWRMDGPHRTVTFERETTGRVTAMNWRDETGASAAHARTDGPFHQEFVRFRSDSVELAATLLLPRAPGAMAGDGRGGMPGAVVIHGSGASDRDNVWAFHIAQHLARHGTAVLIPDKRGSGGSGGDWRSASFDDLAADAIAAAELLARDPRIDARGIGFVGLSQGGWIAPLAATRRVGTAFVINISGAAVTPGTQISHEVRQDLVRAGLPDSAVFSVLRLLELAHGFSRSRDDHAWAAYDRYREELLGSDVADAVRPFPSSRDHWQWNWWHPVVDFDPLPLWRALDVPVLIVYGADDEEDNVPVAESVRLLESALAAGERQSVRVFDGSGHTLGDPRTGWIRDDFLRLLSDWLRQHGAIRP